MACGTSVHTHGIADGVLSTAFPHFTSLTPLAGLAAADSTVAPYKPLSAASLFSSPEKREKREERKRKENGNIGWYRASFYNRMISWRVRRVDKRRMAWRMDGTACGAGGSSTHQSINGMATWRRERRRWALAGTVANQAALVRRAAAICGASSSLRVLRLSWRQKLALNNRRTDEPSPPCCMPAPHARSPLTPAGVFILMEETSAYCISLLMALLTAHALPYVSSMDENDVKSAGGVVAYQHGYGAARLCIKHRCIKIWFQRRAYRARRMAASAPLLAQECCWIVTRRTWTSSKTGARWQAWLSWASAGSKPHAGVT